MKLCVSCRACKRECPTGVDMARMKAAVQAVRAKKHGLSVHDRLVGYLPRYAPFAARLPWLMNLRNRVPGLSEITERLTGFAASRDLPVWSSKPFRDAELAHANPDVVIFSDAFNRYFEPENLRSTGRLLRPVGRKVKTATPIDVRRPLDCGRTLLSIGMVDTKSLCRYVPLDRRFFCMGIAIKRRIKSCRIFCPPLGLSLTLTLGWLRQLLRHGRGFCVWQ